MKRFIPIMIVLAGVVLAAMVLALPSQIASAEPQNGYGTIVIHKSITDYDGKDGTFSFEVVEENGLYTYTAQVTTIAGTGVYTIYPVMYFGMYEITELPQPGWVLDSSYCTGGGRAPFYVGGVDPVHCYFSNHPTTNVYVHKTVEGADAEFSFDSYLEGYYWQYIPIPTVNGEGTYTITLPDMYGDFGLSEYWTENYYSQDQYCLVRGQKTGTWFYLSPFDQIHCYFTNVEFADVTITKTVPYLAYTWFEFLFYSSPENSDEGYDEVGVELWGTSTGVGHDKVIPGWITFAEMENEDFDPGQATCTLNGGAPFDPTAGPFLLVPGDDLECEVSNVEAEEDATILVWKAYAESYEDRAYHEDFVFLLTPTGGGISSYSYPEYQSDDVYYAEFSVPAGSYDLEELETLDTELVDAFCRKDGVEFPLSSLVVAEGDFIECFFTNQDIPATLVLQKVVTGTATTETFDVFLALEEYCYSDDCNEYEGFQDAAISIPVAPDSEMSSFGEVILNDLTPGYYEISEFLKDGYVLIDAGCLYQDGWSDDTYGYINPGEVITCTFTNAYIPEPVLPVTITVFKWAQYTETFPLLVGYEDNDEDMLWSLVPVKADQPTEGGYGGEVTLHGMPGYYEITEGDTLGWRNTDSDCYLSNGVRANWEDSYLYPGDHLVCTFWNEQVPVVHVLKEADHPGEIEIGLFEGEEVYDYWEGWIEMQELCGYQLDGITYWCGEMFFELDPYQSNDPCYPNGCREVTREPARLVTVREDPDGYIYGYDGDPWYQEDAVCTSETAPVTDTTILMTDLDEADCTFTNWMGGWVDIYKYLEPEIGEEEAYTFTFTLDGAAGSFQVDVPVFYNGDYWERDEEFFLPIGKYSVTEDPTPGWMLDDFSCSEGKGREATAADDLVIFPQDWLYCDAYNIPDTGQGLYLSSDTGGVVGGLTFADEDIVVYDGGAWTMFFDGSAYRLDQTDLDAFAFDNNGDLLLSLDIDYYFPGIITKISDEDIVKYDPDTNTFSWYMDSSDVYLSTTQEDIDAIEVMPDGCLLLSTWGDFVVIGVSGQDEDILKFCPKTLGSSTSGAFSLYFNGTTTSVGLTLSTENLDALFLTDELRSPLLHFSTLANFGVPGPVSGEGRDIFTCSPTAYGVTAACSYDPSLFFDGSVEGFPGSVDAAEIEDGPGEPQPLPTRSVPVKSSRPSEM